MANLHITYYRAFPASGQPLAKDMISSEIVTISGANTKSAVTPDSAVAICVIPDAAAYAAYGPTAGKEADASASPRQYIPSGAPAWFAAEPGFKVGSITA